ncbi:carbamoyl-phosphate synthase (glutamine-hydrolyzing) large subunit [Sporolactobacillus sp. THM19-2]|uniref:carbamoyl-phosphate synthase (glutamine-hydrolyzing) large subunit n=1 Tax=Sporolactobacillus sp. THM19-2 TaxID=2511171 RepID=UPI001020B46B|nr:carbamoyl-phosphate synthase (glutamine-hydrolyzing) large subunit [Sporolactobacillus sp. THM19-2]RYL87295.1 carbamoyl-phosphate synthase (glutamine-hydrolyzing) large subunit [Sporolactobacillus sp. THM19-2]
MPLRTDIKKVLVIGSGPIVIGQAAEFDYAGTQACLALKEEGIEVVLINSNPATIMTDDRIADRTYVEPLTVQAIEKIMIKEHPDGLIGTLGGQTGLNLAVELYEKGILARYGVELLGTSVSSIQHGEDRELFKKLMIDIHEPIPESKIIRSYEDGLAFTRKIGYPVIIRPAYTLGGSGGGFAYNDQDLDLVLHRGLNLSPIHEVLIEKSIKGWKEIEYEVMRDANDTCIIVCNMENVDPVGVHTGDSVVVAPSQTLSDVQYQMLRNASLKIIRALKIVGGCNIQFALNPESDEYAIIEVNPRVSRSSALASKATGYPIARVAAKCAIGFYLDEILNPITGTTYASFEPAIDYIVVKIPRFPFDKFTEADHSLGTQMKATGEVMAIDRTFEGALNKGIRSMEMGFSGLDDPSCHHLDEETLREHLRQATDLRLFAIAELMRRGSTVDEMHQLTEIDSWFLNGIKRLIHFESALRKQGKRGLTDESLVQAKRWNIGDRRLAELLGIKEESIRARRQAIGLKPVYHLVDTCAGEFEAETPYYYSTWQGADEAEVDEKPKILIVGSGPIRIGQGIEFDYCCVQATLAVKKLGYEAVVINNNPETVSTDYSTADRLYFEPLSPEDILNVAEKEGVRGALVQFGGQTAVNVAEALEQAGIPVLGTSTKAIEKLEDREQFYDLLTELRIPHIKGTSVSSLEDLREAGRQLGFPILVRPSFVIGGQSMFLFHQPGELEHYMHSEHSLNAQSFPLLVDRYMPGTECEVDAISDGEEVTIPGVFEHIERAGVHSGDSIAVFPSFTLTEDMKKEIAADTRKICRRLHVRGLINIQFVIADGTVYVLEVNPRASRTVPIISKVTGIPMVEKAVAIQLGDKLAALGLTGGYSHAPQFWSVKAPVFSFTKLKGVDPVLGPEMKSTGEQLGMGEKLHEAFTKAVFSGEENPFSGSQRGKKLLISITDRERPESLNLIRRLAGKGFEIVATGRTAAFVKSSGIRVQRIEAHAEAVQSLLAKGDTAAVLNIPTAGRNTESFGFELRSLALRYQIPLYTCLDTLKAAVDAADEDFTLNVHTLDEYRTLTYTTNKEK